MRKFLFLLLLIFCSSVYADPIKKIIFFGDSITDNGNIYKISQNLFPKSPPYYEGRFTNGFTWSDRVAEYYFHKSNIAFENHAYGGATVLTPSSSKRNSTAFPPTLNDEVLSFLKQSSDDKSKMLFIIFIGGNDYFNEKMDIELTTTEINKEIALNIETLIQNGAKNFLILNLPDLSISPFGAQSPIKDKLRYITQQHNKKLAEVIKKLEASYSKEFKFHLYDVFALMDDMLLNTDKYNKKYHLNIKNFKDACWTGGYSIQELQKEKQLTIPNLSKEQLIKSPALLEAYSNSKLHSLGLLEPCVAPDEYFFWDGIHPTAVAHNVMSQMIIEKLGDII